jgi:sec-independent protein translocase protein TatA
MFSSVLLFFEFGAGEIMLIFFVALLLFGGDKLPGLARGLGKGIREFKDASEGIKREISNQIDNFESKKTDTPVIADASTNSPATNEAPAIEGHSDSMPVAEIHSNEEIVPVKAEEHNTVEPTHLRETPIEAQPAQPAARETSTHEEYKS